MAFYKFKRPDSGEDYGSFEAFFVTGNEPNEDEFERGWYWRPCFPGCLPDDNSFGPFDTEDEAINDAQGDL